MSIILYHVNLYNGKIEAIETHHISIERREGGRERGRKGGREGGREDGRDGGKEGIMSSRSL